MNGITCCKNCQDRQLGCHDKCAKYRKARNELNIINEKRKMEKLIDERTVDAVMRRKEHKRKSGAR